MSDVRDDEELDPAEEEAIVVSVAEAGARLDAALARAVPDLSRTRLKALIEAGHVELNGSPATEPSRKVTAGDAITLTRPPAEPSPLLPEPMPLAILYEDADLIVLDKPPGLVVHPAAGNRTGTLVNALLAHCGPSLTGVGGVERPGIVHRLDKDTSGVMVVAKTDRAHQHLSAQFADHGRSGPLSRIYRALAWGAPRRTEITIDAPIGRASDNRERMAVVPGGREAVTHATLVEAFGKGTDAPIASLLDCRLETGRTHQIRVHLAHVGHPLIGDPAYASGFRTKANLLPPALRDKVLVFPRQALHARHLAFAHPRTGKHLAFDSEPPADMANLIAAFRDTIGVGR